MSALCISLWLLYALGAAITAVVIRAMSIRGLTWGTLKDTEAFDAIMISALFWVPIAAVCLFEAVVRLALFHFDGNASDSDKGDES